MMWWLGVLVVTGFWASSALGQDCPLVWSDPIKNKAIQDRHTVIDGRFTEQSCMDACVAYTGFTCLSIEYLKRTKTCQLSEFRRDQVPANHFKRARGYVFRERLEECPDVCSSNPCVHGGQPYLGVSGGYRCFECDAGWGGIRCEIEVDVCSSAPCLNGGRCYLDGSDGYRCFQCDAGWGGIKCETDINECASSPCQHGGICEDGINQYTCSACSNGWEGVNCETAVCYHGGSLGYRCIGCDAGWGGSRCETAVNVCTSNPCINGGMCYLDGSSGYRCFDCGAGWGGNQCQIDTDECASNPCENGGSCTDDVDGYTCTCVEPYRGLNCEAATTWQSEMLAGGDLSDSTFDDADLYGAEGSLNAIDIWATEFVNGIRRRYGEEWTQVCGGQSGTKTTIDIPADNRITKLEGRTGSLIDQLIFTFQDGASQQVGGNGGGPAPTIVVPPGYRVVYLSGTGNDNYCLGIQLHAVYDNND